MRRGDIYYADLGQTYGSKQGGLRPVVRQTFMILLIAIIHQKYFQNK